MASDPTENLSDDNKETVPTTITFALPESADKNVTVVLDTTAIPEAMRQRFINAQARAHILNRVNSALTNFNKATKALAEATEAKKTDPTVELPKAPVQPDYAAIATQAKQDVLEGKFRERGDGEGRAASVEPYITILTTALVRELFNKQRETDKTVKFLVVKQKVGNNGLDYLNKLRDEKAGDNAELRAKFDAQIAARVKAAKAALTAGAAKGDDESLI